MDNILENRKIRDGILVPVELQLDEKGKIIRVTDEYIDISYKSLESASRILSNLYMYKFDYFGKEIFSIEAALQSLKFKDEDVRFACYDYSGVDAWHLRGMNPYDWQKDKILYTPFGEINRDSIKYQEFLDELYFLAFQNPKYKHSLEQSFDKKLDHTIGENNINYTTLTRTEYITRLYALRHCIVNKLNKKEDIVKVLKKVRQEIK